MKPETARKPGARGVLALFVLLLLAVGAAVVFGVLPRLSRQQTLLAASATDSTHTPVVSVMKAARAGAKATLELPGSLVALNEAPIYARADGYVKQRLVDIGSTVKRGQLMAELETPELDQQINQAEAALSQAKASVKQFEANVTHAKASLQLARVTLNRWKKLSEEGVFSKQTEDEKQADFDLHQAELESSVANLAAANNAVSVSESSLKRLQELKAFARITAPFDGVVSGRLTDVGALVTAGNAANRELFRLAQNDPLRIFVSVPQSWVAPVRAAGQEAAKLTVQQLPNRVFPARVSRSNAALDPESRTMLTILYVPNPKGELLPGMFGYVTFQLSETSRPLVIPGDTILSKPDGPHVAVVGPGDRVQVRKIEPGRDFGATMEVVSGVSEGDLLVVNPTDEIREGVRVQRR